MTQVAPAATPCLLCRVAGRVCALPVAHVVETCRPLPVEPVGSSAGAVQGVSIVRGAPLPVVDLAAAIGARSAAPPGRFVVARVGPRHVALGVESVIGVQAVRADQLGALAALAR